MFGSPHGAHHCKTQKFVSLWGASGRGRQCSGPNDKSIHLACTRQPPPSNTSPPAVYQLYRRLALSRRACLSYPIAASITISTSIRRFGDRRSPEPDQPGGTCMKMTHRKSWIAALAAIALSPVAFAHNGPETEHLQAPPDALSVTSAVTSGS